MADFHLTKLNAALKSAGYSIYCCFDTAGTYWLIHDDIGKPKSPIEVIVHPEDVLGFVINHCNLKRKGQIRLTRKIMVDPKKGLALAVAYPFIALLIAAAIAAFIV